MLPNRCVAELLALGQICMETKTEAPKNLESFKKSGEYLSLEKEVKESVAQALASEEGEDIEPVMRLFDKQMAKYQPNAVLKEKLFWGIVADALKDGEFRKIHGEIGPLLDDASKAEQFLNKRLNEIIEKLSQTIYKNLNDRGEVFQKLKSEFYRCWPEIKDLIVGAQEGKKTKTTPLTGQLGEDEFTRSLKRVFGEDKEPRWLLEKNWEVPERNVIKPGLVIEILDVENDKIHKYLILTEPYNREFVGLKEKNKDFSVKTREIGGGNYEIERDLEDWGLAPSLFRGGRWSPNHRPVKWYPFYEAEEFKQSPEKFDLKNRE